ncbi:phage tail protein [Psychrobacter raelei]|uniref:Phage tail protein n=1 Tax=Psychrobacter raelei TaxID=2565531 RepID=A0AAT9PHD4_9GAMM
MGGRGKGGGGGHTPIEQPNTLESAQKLKIIDLLCEGVAGQDVTFKNIYLDNTPVQNEDGSYNFTGIRVSALPGTHNQDYLAGFDSTDKIVSVGAEVKASKPITRTITDPLVDSVRVTLALGSLVTLKDNGDRVGGSVSLTVKCGNKNYPVTITGKTTSAYHQDVVLTDLPDTPFNISVHRNTPDSNTDSVSNATHWVSYVESIDAKFNYPNSVVVGLEIDSAQFGGKIPTRTYLNKWTQIKVPNNYDPITRTYDGIWLGEFKTAWSNNPAWVFYDLATDKRYGLGDRLGEFGCDKWSLYQIAKFCDQIVPDGFGGEEPRFTCNAYISEPSDAKALLDDLASVFRGIAVWDGQQVMALQDAKKDPVATYTNANVADGLFGYQGAGQKTIFTAAHVKYNDKTDGYATKTEYVANDDAIKRYGLNVKQITAFGCTSRGQAARVGKWLIETSIREQQMVSFKVGREGIRHLPFDIIEIADNDYAGDMIAGRVLSVAGNTITADRAMGDIKNIRYYANGQSKTVSVQSVNGTKITLTDTPVGIEQLGVFSATKTDVKPRLFRALSIKEDGDTYTISAVQHDENKEAVVDQGVTFEQDDTATKHTPQVSYGRVSKDGDELLIAWEGTNTTEYLIKVYKDGELYRSYSQDSAEIKLKGLPNGEYKAEIRGKSANGQLTEPVIKEWSIDYDIKGLKATPELFAIKLDWTNPTTVINKAKIEIYRSLSNNRATATKVATLSYPTDTFTQNGVKLSETHYFWLRLIDDQGNTGNWVAMSGQCSDDASQIVASINGKITQTELSKTLIDSLQSDIDTAKTQAVSSANADAASKVAAEAQARAQALQAEAQARAQALQAEVTARQQALAAQDKKQTDALTAKAQELSTQISEVEEVNDAQAKQLTTLTAKKDELVAGLEEERTARIEGDQAEASARQTLVSKVNNAESSITNLQSIKASKTEVASLARTGLQSEWQSAANTAKQQAIDAAKADAEAKANAAKSAAQEYANAQVNAKSVSDKAYADGLISAEERRAIDDANAKLAAAKADAKAKADAAESAAKAHANAQVDAIEIGGRNHFQYKYLSDDSNWEGGSYKTPKQPIKLEPNTEYTIHIKKVDLTAGWGVLLLYTGEKDNKVGIGGSVYNNGGNSKIYHNVEKTFTVDETGNLWLSVYGPNITTYVEEAQIFRGTKLLDWTPAPEDVAEEINNTKASLDEFKQTQASKDQAQTIATNQALSRIGDAESSITNLQSTKASKTEVASLARTGLQSEWQSAANTAKQQAIDAAKADAEAKANAAKSAAQEYANAQVNAKSVSDKAYADGLISAEERRAIDDANAKLAAAKADAKAKADAAESAAKAHANAQVDAIEIGGRNHFQYKYLSDDSNWEGGSYKTPKQPIKLEPNTEYTIHIKKVDLTAGWGVLLLYTGEKDNKVGIGGSVYNNGGNSKIYHNVEKTFTVDETGNLWLSVYGPNITTYVEEAQIFRGTKLLDWTPAPEDVAEEINNTKASLDEFKQTQASKDQAQTIATNQALSRIGDAESSITNLQSTKASKTEVASLARTGLQSEWQSAANTAKQQAIDAAKADAEAKANAAKSAAQEYANAQVNAKSVSDKAYADGLISAEERRAIDDANAKLAAAKADAKAKADAAESAAKAHANAQVDAIEIGGRNHFQYKYLSDDSNWEGGSYKTPKQPIKLEPNTEYTIHIKKVDLTAGWGVLLLYTGEKDNKVGIDGSVYNNDGNSKIYHNVEKTFTVDETGNLWLSVYGPNITTYVEEAQIFRGTKLLDWTPAPEDVAEEINNTKASLDEFKQTQASKDQAQTVATNQAVARIGTAEGKITTLQNTSVTKDKAQSTHTIKTQAIAGGKRAIAGIAVGAMASEQTAESQVIVMADKFGVVRDAGDGVVKPMFSLVNNQAVFNGDLIADGTILGKHIKANQTISAPIINGGELNINNRFIVDRYGNLTALSGRFEGTVLADKISGTIDIESMKRSAWTPSYLVKMSNYYATNGYLLYNPDEPMKDKTLRLPSFGGFTFIAPEYGGGGQVQTVEFSIAVRAGKKTNVSQYLVNLNDILYVKVFSPGGVYEKKYTQGQSEINFELQEGYNTVVFVLANSGGSTAMTVLGDFIDNVNVKFA